MSAITDFIMANYIWFLVGAIIILLAIIGRYADKTNFGRGEKKEVENKEEDFLSENNEDIFKESTPEVKDEVTTPELQQETQPVIEEKNKVVDENVTKTSEQDKNELDDGGIVIEEKRENTASFEELNKEFESVIPEKGIESEGLLEDIDKLSLDKTQAIDLPDIPVLDDVDLPEIKDLRSDDGDVWKF